MRLNDSIQKPLQNEYADVMNTIKKECKLFHKDLFSNSTSNLMFSGRGGLVSYFKGSIKKEREPKDMFFEIHKDFDDQFKRQFGIRARSECLFATGNIGVAADYGNVYIIFPKGKYYVIWSNSIRDLFTHVQKEYQYDNDYKKINALKKRFMIKLNKTTVDSEVEKAYKKYIDDTVFTYRVSPTTTPLYKAIESYNEMMLYCNEYYAIKYSKWPDMLFAYYGKYNKDFYSV